MSDTNVVVPNVKVETSIPVLEDVRPVAPRPIGTTGKSSFANTSDVAPIVSMPVDSGNNAPVIDVQNEIKKSSREHLGYTPTPMDPMLMDACKQVYKGESPEDAVRSWAQEAKNSPRFAETQTAKLTDETGANEIQAWAGQPDGPVRLNSLLSIDDGWQNRDLSVPEGAPDFSTMVDDATLPTGDGSYILPSEVIQDADDVQAYADGYNQGAVYANFNEAWADANERNAFVAGLVSEGYLSQDDANALLAMSGNEAENYLMNLLSRFEEPAAVAGAQPSLQAATEEEFFNAGKQKMAERYGTGNTIGDYATAAGGFAPGSFMGSASLDSIDPELQALVGASSGFWDRAAAEKASLDQEFAAYDAEHGHDHSDDVSGADAAGGPVDVSGGAQVPAHIRAYGNGKVPASALAPIGVGNHRLEANAAAQFRAMFAAAKAAGVTIGVTDSYRSYEAQVDVKRRKPNLAATPGKSNHGWGLALDLALDSKALAWMRSNGGKFGYVEDVKGEPWHWTYHGG